MINDRFCKFIINPEINGYSNHNKDKKSQYDNNNNSN